MSLAAAVTQGRSIRLSALAIALALVAWLVVTEGGLVGVKVLPSPLVIGAEMWTLLQQGYAGTPLYQHLYASLLRTFVGFFCGAALAPAARISRNIGVVLSKSVNCSGHCARDQNQSFGICQRTRFA